MRRAVSGMERLLLLALLLHPLAAETCKTKTQAELGIGRRFYGVLARPSGTSPATYLGGTLGRRCGGDTLETYAWLGWTPLDGTQNGEFDVGIRFRHAFGRGLEASLFAERWMYSQDLAPPETRHNHIIGSGIHMESVVDADLEYRKLIGTGSITLLDVKKKFLLTERSASCISLVTGMQSGHFNKVYEFHGFPALIPYVSLVWKREHLSYTFQIQQQFGLVQWVPPHYTDLRFSVTIK